MGAGALRIGLTGGIGSGSVQPSAAATRPPQSRPSVRLSGSRVVSQSIPDRPISTATNAHHANTTGWGPKRQASAANATPVASSTSG